MPGKQISHSPLIQWLLVLLLVLLLQIGLTIGIHGLLKGGTPGIDYYTFWTAGRTILYNHQSPYSDEVALQSQLGILNRPSRPDEDQMGFAYPLYAFIPILPSLFFPFDWAQPFWLAFNLLAITTTLFIVFPRKPILALGLSLPFYPLTFALILGNLNILVGSIILLSIGLFMLRQNHQKSTQIILGILLAWSTIKPQFVIFYLAFIFLYAIKEKLWPFTISFFISLISLWVLSFTAWPSWLSEWLQRVGSYSNYIPTAPGLVLLTRDFILSPFATIFAYALILVLIALTLWLAVKWYCNQLSLLHILAWLGMISYLIMPYSVSYEQLRFFIPILIWMVLYPRKSLTWWLFGPLFILTSWLIFVFARLAPIQLKIDDLRFLIYLIWMACIFIRIPLSARNEWLYANTQSVK